MVVHKKESNDMYRYNNTTMKHPVHPGDYWTHPVENADHDEGIIKTGQKCLKNLIIQAIRRTKLIPDTRKFNGDIH